MNSLENRADKYFLQYHGSDFGIPGMDCPHDIESMKLIRNTTLYQGIKLRIAIDDFVNATGVITIIICALDTLTRVLEYISRMNYGRYLKIVIYLVIIILLWIYQANKENQDRIISPLPEQTGLIQETTPQTIEKTVSDEVGYTLADPCTLLVIDCTDDNQSAVLDAPTRSTGKITGLASYYSREGCVGCSPNMTMANGQPLDDTALTVAYNDAPLGSILTITNRDTGLSVKATVTDTGGFKKYGKIIDLTIATRDAIGCGSTCRVEVIHNES